MNLLIEGEGIASNIDCKRYLVHRKAGDKPDTIGTGRVSKLADPVNKLEKVVDMDLKLRINSIIAYIVIDARRETGISLF